MNEALRVLLRIVVEIFTIVFNKFAEERDETVLASRAAGALEARNGNLSLRDSTRDPINEIQLDEEAIHFGHKVVALQLRVKCLEKFLLLSLVTFTGAREGVPNWWNEIQMKMS